VSIPTPLRPPYRGRGRPPTHGVLVRPLPRQRQGRAVPATPPDRVTTWTEGDAVIRAEEWADRLGTIGYEIVCGIGGRIPRVLVGGAGR